jgi:ubiquinone/menaquinone biosynthesis C-methylase UbiE
LNAEDMSEVSDGEYDLVLVQDGLHHLPRPALGLTEMLRVARRAVVVIEPYDALVARLIGTTWEQHDEAVNYVFRWTSSAFAAVTRSYVGQAADVVDARLWDHGAAVHRAVRVLPDAAQFSAARLVYGALRPFNRMAGNQFVGAVVKHGVT